MKNILPTIGFAICMLAACHPTYVVQENPSPAPAPAPAVSYQSFYDELSPYGHWIDYPGYGYVWMPAVDPGFRPYATNGNWIYTDAGWTWASNYSWGWAPFHYGRWFYEGGYGWMWMPGNEWSPAWVSWRTSNDYYGWAPLGPNVTVGMAVNYNPPANYWCFVPHQYIANPHINNYYVNETKNVTIINNTTVINNVTYNKEEINNTTVNNNYRNVYRGGPDPREVERYTGSTVRTVPIRENNRPGEQMNNGQYAIYRPQVNTSSQQSSGGATTRMAPSRVESLHDIRPVVSNASNNNPNNNQPATRNNNTYATPSNNPNSSMNENLPNSNARQQGTLNNNEPSNNRYNNNHNANANSPVNSTNNNQQTAPNNNTNNRPADAQYNNRNNAYNNQSAVNATGVNNNSVNHSNNSTNNSTHTNDKPSNNNNSSSKNGSSKNNNNLNKTNNKPANQQTAPHNPNAKPSKTSNEKQIEKHAEDKNK
ncbi:MAG TPA: DUF6600 domain-containing protein [Puia sp.]|nr:DUF6600 domain-containing protein [Puia sp.]